MGKLNPKELTINYKDLLKSTTIGERTELVKSRVGQDLLSALTPTELGNLFPDYYKRSSPDVSGFLAARKKNNPSDTPPTNYSVPTVVQRVTPSNVTNQQQNTISPENTKVTPNNTPINKQSVRPDANLNERQRLIRELADEYGVNPRALAGIFSIESNFRTDIKGGAGGNYHGVFQLQDQQIPGLTTKAGLGALNADQYRALPLSDQLKVYREYIKGAGITKGFFTGDEKQDSARLWALQLAPGNAKKLDYNNPNTVISATSQAAQISQRPGLVTVGSVQNETVNRGRVYFPDEVLTAPQTQQTIIGTPQSIQQMNSNPQQQQNQAAAPLIQKNTANIVPNFNSNVKWAELERNAPTLQQENFGQLRVAGQNLTEQQQINRPSNVQSRVMVGNNFFRLGSGSSESFPQTPYGTYTLSHQKIGSTVAGILQRYNVPTTGAYSDTWNVGTPQNIISTGFDPKLKRNITEIQIHPGTVKNQIDKLWSNGCLSIDPAEYPAFVKAMEEQAKLHGRLALVVTPDKNGKATFSVLPATQASNPESVNSVIQRHQEHEEQLIAQQQEQQNPQVKKQNKTALLAAGTNDWDDEEKAYQGIIRSAKAIQQRGEDPTLVLPAKLVNGKPHAYNAALRAAKELKLKTEEPNEFGKDKDHYHLTANAAKTIKEKYPNASVYGDSNAVRLGATENQTGFTGASAAAIAERLEQQRVQQTTGTPRGIQQMSSEPKTIPHMQSGGTVGDDVQAVSLNAEVGPGKEDTALINPKGQIEALAKSDETVQKSPHEGDTQTRIVPKTRTRAEEIRGVAKEEALKDAQEEHKDAQVRTQHPAGTEREAYTSNMDKIKGEIAVATGYVATDAMNRVQNRVRMKKVPGDYHYDTGSANEV